MAYRIYLRMVFFSMLVFSCKEKEEIEGPDLHLLYGELGVIEDLESSTDNVDFASGEKAYFMARFKKIVNWKLRLRRFKEDDNVDNAFHMTQTAGSKSSFAIDYPVFTISNV